MEPNRRRRPRNILILDDNVSKTYLHEYFFDFHPNFECTLIRVPKDTVTNGRNVANSYEIRHLFNKVQSMGKRDIIILLLGESIIRAHDRDTETFLPCSVLVFQDFLETLAHAIQDRRVSIFITPPQDRGQDYGERILRINQQMLKRNMCLNIFMRRLNNFHIAWPDRIIKEHTRLYPQDVANHMCLGHSWADFFNPYGRVFQRERLKTFTEFLFYHWYVRGWIKQRDIRSPYSTPQSFGTPPPPTPNEEQEVEIDVELRVPDMDQGSPLPPLPLSPNVVEMEEGTSMASLSSRSIPSLSALSLVENP